VSYIIKNPAVVGSLLLEHLLLIGTTLAIAVSIALPIGLLVTRYRWLKVPAIGLLGVFYTIPSLALIILLVPIFGLNPASVIASMVIYAQVILVRNLVVGLESIPATISAAARGMGMNPWQRWWWVQVPLILPIFIAGLRIAAIVGIAIATVGAKFGAGGLGVLLFDGIAQNRNDKILAGAIVVSLLAFAINGGLLVLERLANPSRRVSKT